MLFVVDIRPPPPHAPIVWQYADAADRADMEAGPVPCSAARFVEILAEHGLSPDQSAVPFRREYADGRPYIPQPRLSFPR